jgi:hypothetical protein
LTLFGSKPDPEAYYQQVKVLVETLPNLLSVDDKFQTPAATHIWLGRLTALVEQGGDLADAMNLKLHVPRLLDTRMNNDVKAEREITAVLYRALARAEIAAPTSVRGSFIAVGEHFDVFRAIKEIFGSAREQLLIVDPYLDEVVLTDFLPLANEGVVIRLLCDEASIKPTLKPASERWIAQHGQARPLQTMTAPARSLHDRLIFVDQSSVWILTQSLKDFAGRAPGTIQKADADLAKLKLKLEAYETIWNSAQAV